MMFVFGVVVGLLVAAVTNYLWLCKVQKLEQMIGRRDRRIEQLMEVLQ